MTGVCLGEEVGGGSGGAAEEAERVGVLGELAYVPLAYVLAGGVEVGRVDEGEARAAEAGAAEARAVDAGSGGKRVVERDQLGGAALVVVDRAAAGLGD